MAKRSKRRSTRRGGREAAEVEALIGESKYEEALDYIDDLDETGRGSIRLRQLEGLALARLGHHSKALSVLDSLYHEGKLDPETWGIYARCWMDSYDRTGRLDDLRCSRDLYAEAFKRTPEDYFTGINAATKSMLLGEDEVAGRYVGQVEKVVGTRPTRGDYWTIATAAEAQLLRGRYAEAAELYRRAVLRAPTELGHHDTTWLQARRLFDAMDVPEEDRARINAAFSHRRDASPVEAVSKPASRRLRVFAFDPGLATSLDTAAINEVTLRVRWESDKDGNSLLDPGPVGEYLEVIDYDPASDCFYEPVDLDDPRVLAADGCAPSEGDPKFHQQMVYAVSMNVIEHFERALGRRVLWAPRPGSNETEEGEGDGDTYVQRLRVYPHALQEANAYYSPQKKALLFGYFPAEEDDPSIFPGGMVFTCLSHDVIAHEMTHALLDGIHPHFTDPTNLDVLAFHEAFADVVALFQHFSHAEVLMFEIARTRGDLESQNLLGELAQQFGRAIGRYGALRSAIGEIDQKTGQWRPKQPDPSQLDCVREPHARGAILVAAIFDAFLSIYKSRIPDLLRIATQGSGVLPPGEIHPDLVRRLAGEAAKTARQILQICIRALDYCPPVDITFGDYLRAMITADLDMVPDDRRNYRLAIIGAFQQHGIYPGDVRNLSVESLIWRPPRTDAIDVRPLFRDRYGDDILQPQWRPTDDRGAHWEKMQEYRRKVLAWLRNYGSPSKASELGLALGPDAPRSIYRVDGRPNVEVHSVRLAWRTRSDGGEVQDLVIEILQERHGYLGKEDQEKIDNGRRLARKQDSHDFVFRGGCTLLVDPETCRVRYAVSKHIASERRLRIQREFLGGGEGSLRATYFGDPRGAQTPAEPFAMLHRPLEEGGV